MTLPHPNDDRAARYLTIPDLDSYDLRGTILIAGFGGFLVGLFYAHFFELPPVLVGIPAAAGLVVGIALLWLEYADHRNAPNEEAPDEFYQELAEYLKTYPEHRTHVVVLTKKGRLTLREAKHLAETLNRLQEKLHPNESGKDLFLRTVSPPDPSDSPAAARQSA